MNNDNSAKQSLHTMTSTLTANSVYAETRPEILAEIRSSLTPKVGSDKILSKNPEYIRILAVLKEEVWAIYISASLSKPIRYSRPFVEGLIASNEWALQTRDPIIANRATDTELSSKTISRRDRDNAILAPFRELGLRVFDPAERWRCVRQVALSRNIHELTVLRLLLRWFRGGMGQNAVVGRWFQRRFRRGIGSAALSVAEIRSGRKPPRFGRRHGTSLDSKVTPSESHVYNVSAIDIEKILAGARKYLHLPTGLNITEAWHRTVAEYYIPHLSVLKIEELAARIEETPPGIFPSLAQFRRYIKCEPSLEKILRRAHGRKFPQRLRKLNSRTEINCSGPGEVYQIDGTKYDLIVVHELSRRPVGRVALYIMVDCYTHMIVGYHIDFLHAGIEPVSICLVNAASPKPEFCQRYGINIPADYWPAAHLPKSIVADSELSSKKAFNLARFAAIEVSIAPAYRPDLKGLVESLIGAITRYARMLPGYSTGQRQRATTNPEHTAALDYKELNRIVIRWIFKHNRRRIRNYAKTDDMRIDIVNPTPTDLWKWGVVNASGYLRSEDPQTIMKTCLPQKVGRITGRGLEFGGAVYEPFDPASSGNFELACSLARLNGSTETTVTYHPNSIDEVWEHRDGELIKMKLSPLYNINPGTSRYDFDQDQENERDAGTANRNNVEISDAADSMAIQKDVVDGERKTEAVRGSVAKRKSEKIDKNAEREDQIGLAYGLPQTHFIEHSGTNSNHDAEEVPEGLDEYLGE